jgi:hypothetical protein
VVESGRSFSPAKIRLISGLPLTLTAALHFIELTARP